MELRGRAEAMRRVSEIVQDLAQGTLKVGFQGGSYPDGTPVAAVAFWNEFGVPSRGQKPRPFFRRMISKESPHWGAKAAQLARAYNFNGERVLNALGEDIEGALKESIATLINPELRPSTVKAKGSNKPLVDTGQMIRSPTYRVDR